MVLSLKDHRQLLLVSELLRVFKLAITVLLGLLHPLLLLFLPPLRWWWCCGHAPRLLLLLLLGCMLLKLL